jgi:hypothetical protein
MSETIGWIGATGASPAATIEFTFQWIAARAKGMIRPQVVRYPASTIIQPPAVALSREF